MQMGVIHQEGLVSFPDQKINLSIREKAMQFFNDRRREHHVADESRLYDQEFLQRFLICEEQEFLRIIRQQKKQSGTFVMVLKPGSLRGD
jgi:predicted RNA-binding protein with RPS1 domain